MMIDVPFFFLIIGLAALIAAGIIWGLRNPNTGPGLWYAAYHRAWHAAHPGAWERGELESGGFFKGNVWGSSTPDWDREWFLQAGLCPPRKMIYVAPRGGMASTSEPSDSVSFRLNADTETGQIEIEKGDN